MPSTITIRRAEHRDGPTLQAIEIAAGARFRTVGLPDIADADPFTIEELDAYGEAAHSWVAVDAADEPVGYVVVDDVDGHAHIEQVSVVPDHQGEGIGRALIDHVDAWAAADQRTALTLTTFIDVAWNQPLYEHLGFRVLAEDEIGPGLQTVRADEATHGLDPTTRVCMWRDVTGACAMETVTDRQLYDRGIDTAVAGWEAIARGATNASVLRLDGVSVGVFPVDPERSVYNNAVLARDHAVGGPGPEDAVDTMERIYAAARVDRFAAWIHEDDDATRAELEHRGYRLEETTRAMGLVLADLDPEDVDATPVAAIGPLPWPAYRQFLQRFGLPADLLAGVDPDAFTTLAAGPNGEVVATALAFDHDGDCGVYNVATLEEARRRGLGTTLTARLVHDGRERGCTTATLQSSPMAERIYASIGFRDLGRILELVPPGGRHHS